MSATLEGASPSNKHPPHLRTQNQTRINTVIKTKNSTYNYKSVFKTKKQSRGVKQCSK